MDELDDGPTYALTDQQLESFRNVFTMYAEPVASEEEEPKCKWEHFPAMFRAVNQNPTLKELDTVIAEFKKGETFDVDCFLRIMDSPFNADPSTTTTTSGSFKPEVLIEAFRKFDRDGAGILKAAVMRYALGCIGDALEIESVDEFMDYAHSVADKEKTGEIDYELLVKNLFEKDPGITACL